MGVANNGSKRKKEAKLGKVKTLRNNFYIIKLVWVIEPKRVFIEFLKNGFSYFSWVFYSVVFVRYIFSAVEKGKGFREIAVFVIATMAVVMLLDFFAKWYEFYYKPISDTGIYEKLYAILFDKATAVDLACYEDTNFYNTYTVAMKEADSRATAVLDNLSGIFFSLAAAVTVFWTMYSIDRYVVFFALFPIIGNFVFGRIRNRLTYARDLDGVPYRRRMEYVNRVLYLQDYAKEIRLSNIFTVLRNQYAEGFKGIIEIVNQYRLKVGTVTFWQYLTTFTLIFEGVLCYGAYRALVTKTITLADFAVLGSAMVSGAWNLIRLSEKLVDTYKNGLYVENLHKFLNYESEMTKTDTKLSPGQEISALEIANLSFTYLGASRPVLDGINIKIRKKEKIALVGHNGAGKTTLVKLLMRLYDPSAGEIRLNGVNIKEYDLEQYRALFGTAFQDYQVFALPVAENVLMKEVTRAEEEEQIRSALQRTGVYKKIATLPKEMYTMLTREFDDSGVVLSGGELQKIAVARAFCKNFQIIILDEPSSALDPIAEYQLFESMMEACHSKIVIFISHRLSSAVLADIVYLLEDGKVIEQGSHRELMAQNGKYAELFRKQAEKYLAGADHL
ncbi:MAG TPA: ABC transporter ATP-binding protein [Firmicutes bacterium]|jgi:ATP-binding cassette subfamily B protein|nr:ABC transporter ATP-binding protein [Bacillota bacterium]